MENAQPEPSMEEILASIRRIISEDEEEQPTPAAKAPEAQKEAPRQDTPQPEAPKPAEPELTLTPASAATPPHAPDVANEDKYKTEDVEIIKQTTAAPMQHDSEQEILDQSTAAAASQAFQNLSQSVRISEGPGKTLEDIVTDMLKPMVKEWLDSNLPAIVEEKVEEEVQRVARRRRG